ncbi:hypothetical protein BAUCODRAFT_109720 [Baudoinia panamericana UAMH 10762]|uniref:Uncharacterized protein n=1 Tax=Baudoinia panamericana (strain UAMH 10762) TaxID=717646 RepID=M2NAU7_BAUPA|nr:uncharacterized protein BAUCODRAFT_109720 [Baudoinia panamericana UAMH 10762]EMC95965.1 hypothetical protein BAUCODRAFT_109720 [Baudoinia panamericana UAMH 10762]
MSIFEDNAPLNDARATETAHRKVELQSPADLTYLIANVSRAAREKLDKHLPPDAALDSDDAMRKRVEQLVDEYIRNTFNAAKDGMSINGMDSKEMDAELAKAQDGEAEIEPFDTKLAQRIQALSAQIEHHTLQLANLRRTVPAETARRYQNGFESQRQAYDQRFQNDHEAKLKAARMTTVDAGQVERLDEVQNAWTRGSRDLLALKSGLGGTVARMEKAQQAASVVQER